MRTRTAVILGTVICMIVWGCAGYAGLAYPSVSLWDIWEGNFVVFFLVFMLRSRKKNAKANRSSAARGGPGRDKAGGYPHPPYPEAFIDTAIDLPRQGKHARTRKSRRQRNDPMAGGPRR